MVVFPSDENVIPTYFTWGISPRFVACPRDLSGDPGLPWGLYLLPGCPMAMFLATGRFYGRAYCEPVLANYGLF